MDPNLGQTQLRLVPDEVNDTEFWRNFFYHIELWRKEQGGSFESRLGPIKDEQAKQAAIQEELRKANEEINKLKAESEADLGEAVQVADDDTIADMVNANDTAETGEIEL